MRHIPPSLLASVLRTTVPDCTEESVLQYLRIVYGSDASIRAAEAAAPHANEAAAPLPSTGKTGGKGGGFKGVSHSRAVALSYAKVAALAATADASEGAAAPPMAPAVLVPTAEAVVALIRRGWEPHIPSIATVVQVRVESGWGEGRKRGAGFAGGCKTGGIAAVVPK